jgi:thiamine-monophosphate kinase
MGALPVAAVCNLQVPRGATAEQIRQVGRGQARRSLAQRCPIVGGNLSSGDRWQFTTSVLGAAKRPLLRGGALVGDELWLCGAVGEAGAGLSLLQRGSIEVTRSPTLHRAMRRCISAWRSPIARIAFGRELVGRAHAAIDVSDGLASEAEHLANSAQLRIVLHADALRGSSAAVRRVAAELELEPLHLLLNGGEDYALLAAGPTRARPKFARVVGRVEAGSGVVLEDATTQRALRGGFDHFTRTKR